MKKIVLIIFLIIFGFCTNIVNCKANECSKESICKKIPDVIIQPDPDPKDIPISDVEIASNSTVTTITSFDGFTHSKFGLISYVSESTTYDKEMWKTYQSGIFPNDFHESEFTTYRYDTYTFQKYVDLPVKLMYSRKLNALESTMITIETIQSTEESTTLTSSIATNLYLEYSYITIGTFVYLIPVE